MQKILFVCLGNICRSPLAAAVFKHLLYNRNLRNNFHVASCGTSNYHIGENADKRTILNAKKHGIEINHKASQLNSKMIADFDVIFVMDKSNYTNAVKLCNSQQQIAKIHMLHHYDPLKTAAEVPDPYYGDESDFEETFQIVYRCCENYLDSLLENP